MYLIYSFNAYLLDITQEDFSIHILCRILAQCIDTDHVDMTASIARSSDFPGACAHWRDRCPCVIDWVMLISSLPRHEPLVASSKGLRLIRSNPLRDN